VAARHMQTQRRSGPVHPRLQSRPDKREGRSAKHRRAVEKVATLHRKVRRQRTDHAHKTARAIVRTYVAIAHERLNIANMVRTPKPKPDPERPGSFLPNGAAAKAGLNKSIHDAGWGVFLGILAHKAESAGRVLIPVDPRNTSRTCPRCGHVAKGNRPTQEKFECTKCGHTANADQIGALNVASGPGWSIPTWPSHRQEKPPDLSGGGVTARR